MPPNRTRRPTISHLSHDHAVWVTQAMTEDDQNSFSLDGSSWRDLETLRAHRRGLLELTSGTREPVGMACASRYDDGIHLGIRLDRSRRGQGLAHEALTPKGRCASGTTSGHGVFWPVSDFASLSTDRSSPRFAIRR